MAQKTAAQTKKQKTGSTNRKQLQLEAKRLLPHVEPTFCSLCFLLTECLPLCCGVKRSIASPVASCSGATSSPLRAANAFEERTGRSHLSVWKLQQLRRVVTRALRLFCLFCSLQEEEGMQLKEQVRSYVDERYSNLKVSLFPNALQRKCPGTASALVNKSFPCAAEFSAKNSSGEHN